MYKIIITFTNSIESFFFKTIASWILHVFKVLKFKVSKHFPTIRLKEINHLNG